MTGQAGAHLGDKDNVADSIRPGETCPRCLTGGGRMEWGLYAQDTTSTVIRDHSRDKGQNKDNTETQAWNLAGQSRNNEKTGKTKGVPCERL